MPVTLYDKLPPEETYEVLARNANPKVSEIIQGIDIVKKFIIDRGLILYGGTAIDFALRLKGDPLYNDEALKIPDLDFYSPNNVQDAYDLTEMLMKKFDDVGALVAMHPQTMRVRLHYNYVADITYVDPEIFEKIPTLNYDRMKFVHPEFQRIDMLFSLTFPLDNPPLENITNRLKKDNTRLALYEKHYPIMKGTSDESTAAAPKDRPVTVMRVPLSDIGNGVLDGFAAYAALTHAKHKLISVDGDTLVIKLPAIYTELDIIDNDHVAVMTRFVGAKITHYEELLNIRPEYMKIRTAAGVINVGEYPNKWLPIKTIEINGTKLRTVCAPAVMMFLLSRVFIDRKNADIYRAYYAELLGSINEPIMQISDELYATGENLYPSVSNMIAREKFNMRLTSDNVALEIPKGYYDAAKKPTFDVSKSRFFKTSGRAKD